jgi:hypothetical protein
MSNVGAREFQDSPPAGVAGLAPTMELLSDRPAPVEVCPGPSVDIRATRGAERVPRGALSHQSLRRVWTELHLWLKVTRAPEVPGSRITRTSRQKKRVKGSAGSIQRAEK